MSARLAVAVLGTAPVLWALPSWVDSGWWRRCDVESRKSHTDEVLYLLIQSN